MEPLKYLLSCLVITLCVPLFAQDSSTGQTPEEFAKQVNKYLREHGAAVNEELKATRDALAKISADMEVQSKTIKELERLIAKLSMENARLKKESAKLTAALEAEKQSRADSDLRLAQALKQAIPSTVGSGGKETVEASPAAVRKYTVQRGDVLGNIAKAFNTTVEAIQRENKLNGTLIHPGQVLIIP